jgi:hypothetical protein
MESRFNPPPAETNGPGAEGTPGRPPTGLGDVVANVGDRVQEILDAAERIAGEIRAEAEAAGENYVYERRREAERAVEEGVREFTGLTHSVTARVETLQREASALVEVLEDARRRLAALAQSVEPQTQPTFRASPPQAPSPPRPEVAETDASEGEKIPEQAILRATQMAVAGIERTEIELMLRTEFGIRDPASVVDQMLRSERA